MNIVPNVELSIDELFYQGLGHNKSMEQTNISIEGIIKQVKPHLCIK